MVWKTELVGTTYQGYNIFVEPDGEGGRCYYSDAIGESVSMSPLNDRFVREPALIWKTNLVTKEELLMAIEHEREMVNGQEERN